MSASYQTATYRTKTVRSFDTLGLVIGCTFLYLGALPIVGTIVKEGPITDHALDVYAQLKGLTTIAMRVAVVLFVILLLLVLPIPPLIPAQRVAGLMGLTSRAFGLFFVSLFFWRVGSSYVRATVQTLERKPDVHKPPFSPPFVPYGHALPAFFLLVATYVLLFR